MTTSAPTTGLRSTIEPAAFANFMTSFRAGSFEGQRLGQAFFHHFALHKMHDASQRLDRLYEMDGDDALSMIHSLFDVQSS